MCVCVCVCVCTCTRNTLNKTHLENDSFPNKCNPPIVGQIYSLYLQYIL